MILLLALVTWGIAFLVDYKPVYKEGRPAVKWVCAVILAVGAVAQVLYELHVPVPSPTEPLSDFVNNVLNLR